MDPEPTDPNAPQPGDPDYISVWQGTTASAFATFTDFLTFTNEDPFLLEKTFRICGRLDGQISGDTAKTNATVGVNLAFGGSRVFNYSNNNDHVVSTKKCTEVTLSSGRKYTDFGVVGEVSATISLANDGLGYRVLANYGNTFKVSLELPPDVTFTSRSGVFLTEVENASPVADAGDNQALSLLGEVTLDGTNSFDPDDDPITYAWTLPEIPTNSSASLDDPTSATPRFTADQYGNYVASLTVSDGRGGSSTDTVTIGFENLPPTAEAGLNQAAVVGDTVLLDGSGSSDPNEDALAYHWSFEAKPALSTTVLSNATTVNPTFVIDAPGDYRVKLMVNDGLLDSAPSTVLVTAITAVDAITALLMEAIEVINTFKEEDFKNRNMQNALTNKFNAVLGLIDQEDYQSALEKLLNDIAAKMDGCAGNGAPDANDWITTCEKQAKVNELINEAKPLIERLINE